MLHHGYPAGLARWNLFRNVGFIFFYVRKINLDKFVFIGIEGRTSKSTIELTVTNSRAIAHNFVIEN